MSAGPLKRARERVIGGTPSPWDRASAWGVCVGAILMAMVFARGRQVDDIPVLGPREELLLALFAVGPALLVSFPLVTLLSAAVGSARPAVQRARAWLLGAAVLVIVSGFAAPLALRAAWSVDPEWKALNEPQAYLVTQVADAATFGQPAGLTPEGWWGQREIPGRLATWVAAIVTWLACWPLVRRRPRVHVGWPALLSLGVLTVAAMLARSFLVSRSSELEAILIVSATLSLLPCLVAWRFVASAGARWPLEDDARSPRENDPRSPREIDARSPRDALQLGRVAAIACVAIVGWVGFLAVLSPPALRSIADAFRSRPRVGDLAPDFAVKDRDGATIRLSELRGRPVLVSFGASWCGPCREEFPHLAVLAENGGGVGLTVLWLSKDAERAALEEYLAEQPKIPTIALANEDVLLSYDVEGIPSTFLIDRAGRVAWRQVGFGRGAETRITDAIAALPPAS